MGWLDDGPSLIQAPSLSLNVRANTSGTLFLVVQRRRLFEVSGPWRFRTAVEIRPDYGKRRPFVNVNRFGDYDGRRRIDFRVPGRRRLKYEHLRVVRFVGDLRYIYIIYNNSKIKDPGNT